MNEKIIKLVDAFILGVGLILASAVMKLIHLTWC